ncbi:MAG TPA: Ppx/GppA phosphatase family protein [Syntrophomonadaceae bacterium]|nr:Ppx/GppA phosphatase family protein [Syntrophomonadaceae bacterium]
MRYGVIDIGTNSCRLLIADLKAEQIFPVYRALKTNRFSLGMKNNSFITDEMITRTCQCLDEFKNIIAEHEVDSYKVIATSAVREAENKAEFIRLVKKRCNIYIEVITGEEEAYLSYIGVKNGLGLKTSPLVVDLGGGSTEVIFEQDFIQSLPVGAVRVQEMNMSKHDISQALKPLLGKKDEFIDNHLVFVGGTATSAVAIKFALEVYSSKFVHGKILTRQELADLFNSLEKMPLSIRKSLPGLHPERADIINDGILIILMIMDIYNKQEMIVCESDLMEGIILSGF